MTYSAVRISERPGDEGHLYGHGKTENFSALLETMLLLITCGWIVYEALQRFRVKELMVEANAYSFGVMAVSVVVDFSRSRALARTARKYGSQALEADALHFQTDIWGSLVVILGLIFVRFGYPVADALAALVVALVISAVSLRLAKRAIYALLDRAPAELPSKIADEVNKIAGVLDCQRLRVREAGPFVFVDMIICVSRTASLEEAHAVASMVEERVRRLVPRVDVMVHIDPRQTEEGESAIDVIRMIADRRELKVHDIRVYDVRGQLSVDLHVEVSEELNLKEAHQRVSELEADIVCQVEGVGEINTHIEPGEQHVLGGVEVVEEADWLIEEVRKAAHEINGILDCHDIVVRRTREKLSVTLHCVPREDLSIAQAHRPSSHLERQLVENLEGVDRVLVHLEPL